MRAECMQRVAAAAEKIHVRATLEDGCQDVLHVCECLRCMMADSIRDFIIEHWRR